MKWGNCNYKDFIKLRENIEKLGNQRQRFCEECARELAARLLSLVIPRTPTGKTIKQRGEDGKKRTVHMGGTLRRGWTAKTEVEAEHGRSAGAAYAKELTIDRVGDNYQITVINPVHYASYVEFGHRTADRKGWVKGQYFLTIAEKQLREWMPGRLEKKLEKFLSDAFKGIN